LDAEVEKSVQNGKFAWALNQNQAVLVEDSDKKQSLALHVLATRSRVVGMFAGLLKNETLPFYKQKLKLVSIIIHYAANSLESVFLFNLLKGSRDRLQVEVELKTKEYLKERDKANKSNLAKSEFLANMSHELRTPLNSMMGFTQILQLESEATLKDEERNNLGRILTAGKHMLGLINEVLDLSKIESGNLKLSIISADMVFIVKEAISISKPMADKNGIEIKIKGFPSGSFFVLVDETRFKQVVLNLVSNAIKYNRPNGAVVISFEERGNGRVRLGVRDTGYGIPEDKQSKLFKPFERLGVASDKIEGTGIGLTITKQLVKKMGGAIGFKSVPGKGSLFYVEVPVSSKKSGLRQSKESEMQVKEEKNKKLEKIAEKNKGSAKILYIEDTAENVELVAQAFSFRQDLKLISAPNALDGIKLAQEEKPDLILMDIHLPEINGFEAFQKLSELEATCNIPVIALTANAMSGDEQKAMDMGFKEYITKPIDVKSFIQSIDEHIG